MPTNHVTVIQLAAATKPQAKTSNESAVGKISCWLMVLATAVPKRIGPSQAAAAAQKSATRGVKAREEITVATTAAEP